MNLNVTVEDLDLATVVGGPDPYDGTPVTLADRVAAEVVTRLVDREEWRELNHRVHEIRDEEIRAAITPMIQEAISAPVQRTNIYGEPRGEAVSLREVVVDEARKVLQGTNSSSSYRGEEPLGRKLVKEMVAQQLRKELSEVIAAERQKVVDAVRAEASDLIAKAITAGIGGGR